ncbi:unnamed protein product, partial [Cyprideis torosa]
MLPVFKPRAVLSLNQSSPVFKPRAVLPRAVLSLNQSSPVFKPRAVLPRAVLSLNQSSPVFKPRAVLSLNQSSPVFKPRARCAVTQPMLPVFKPRAVLSLNQCSPVFKPPINQCSPVFKPRAKQVQSKMNNPTSLNQMYSQRETITTGGGNVFCPDVPIIEFALGSKLIGAEIKVGDDVYFECKIQANPEAFKTYFTHEDVPLRQNVSGGIIVTNQTLVLQRVKRKQAGSYHCHAENIDGKGNSEPVNLNIKFAPECNPSQRTVYGVALLEQAVISCQVESEPLPTSFRWAFNVSSDVVDVPKEQHQDFFENGTSVLRYLPKTELDYGTLLCWAKNEIGEQRLPCVFHVLQT